MIVDSKQQTLLNLARNIELVQKHLGITQADEVNPDDIIVEELNYDDAIMDDILSQELNIGDVTIISEVE